MVVDFHTHVFPDAIAAAAIARLVETSGGRAKPHYDGTLGGLVAAMDRCGVDVSVTQPVATRPEQVRSINSSAADTRSARIEPFGAMHPALADPAEEIERMSSLGLRGFKMHPEYQEFLPDDPALSRIWSAAEDHGMVVLFHAGADLCFDTMRGTAERFATLLQRHPGLRVVLAHLGGYEHWTAVERLLCGADVWLDTAFTLGHLPDDEFVALARAHGIDRVLFGSDGPWTDAAAEMAHLGRLGLTAEELGRVLGGNAERLLGHPA